MNLLFVNSIRMWGGAEVWFLRVMQGLAERGHATHLACVAGTPLDVEARRRGLAVHAIPVRGDFEPASIAATYRLLERFAIQLVITNRDKDLRFASAAAKLAGGIPVLARRAVGEPPKNTWRSRLTYNHLATHILANSEMTRRTLLAGAPWLRPERITVIYNGLDPETAGRGDRAGIRRRHEIPLEAPVIGFVGQLIPRKGIRYLLDAFRIVYRQLPDARLLLVGSGPLASDVEALRREPGMSGAVIPAGFREDAVEYMKAFDVLALPALEEGLANVLIEAMAAGLAIVTTDTSSMPEAVRQDRDGILVPPRDADALAGALLALLRDPARVHRMGASGQERVAEKFTRDRMLDELERLFQDLANGARRWR